MVILSEIIANILWPNNLLVTASFILINEIFHLVINIDTSNPEKED